MIQNQGKQKDVEQSKQQKIKITTHKNDSKKKYDGEHNIYKTDVTDTNL